MNTQSTTQTKPFGPNTSPTVQASGPLAAWQLRVGRDATEKQRKERAAAGQPDFTIDQLRAKGRRNLAVFFGTAALVGGSAGVYLEKQHEDSSVTPAGTPIHQIQNVQENIQEKARQDQLTQTQQELNSPNGQQDPGLQVEPNTVETPPPSSEIEVG